MYYNDKHRLLGWITSGLLLVSSIIFIIVLAGAKILSGGLIFICALFFALLLAGVFALGFDSRKKAKAIIAVVLAVIIIAAQCFGIYYISIGRSTLEQITKPEIDFAEVGVFVRNEDPAQSLGDVKEYKFGILDVQDRVVTDLAIEKINSELSAQINDEQFSGIENLMDALLRDKKVDCIIINKSFLELLDETENHKDDAEKIREIHSVQIETEGITEDTLAISEKVFTVYISGIDCRGSLSRRSRSDVNILMTVNTETGQVLLISTPRDYYVPLSNSKGIPDKLTHAGIYGIDVSRDTLEMLYDTNIDYYFRVNFDGFEEIINALGGIKVNSEVSFNDGKHKFRKGENYLNGEEALVFARNRYSIKGGDRQRGKNQMAVIKGVIDKAASPAIILNYKQTLDGMAGSFETDMPYETIAKLIRNQINDGTSWNVVSYSVNGKGASRKPYSLSTKAYVMIPDEKTVDHAKELIEQVKDGYVPEP
ncbi:MAG: LCP family protein [Acutalibacteraceae bacterium]|nr:LCP family protein [Acutalibacteraceae bacterium]